MRTLLLLSLLSFSSFANLEQCPKLKFDGSNPEQTYIAKRLCFVLHESYPDFLRNEIKVQAIEDNKLTNYFSKGQFTFLSFFNLKHLIPGPWGYYIAYSRNYVFHNGKPIMSDKSVESILMHELAHTWTWRRWPSLSSLFLGAYVFAFTNRGKFERRTDIVAIKKGIESGHLYGSETFERRFYSPEAHHKDSQVYYGGQQVFAIEQMALSLKGKMRKKFFRKIYRKAPYALKEIQRIFVEIKYGRKVKDK